MGGQVLQCNKYANKLTYMVRLLRVELPKAIYHIVSRSKAKEPIFLDDTGKVSFLGS
jgi:hypothetical protein